MRRLERMIGVARLLRAASFAARKHRDQRRKDAEASPYINHSLAVATLLAEEGAEDDEILLVAALLHDTVEDTETTFDELERLFGSEVRNLVAEVSDDKRLAQQERKRLQVLRSPSASPRAKRLKIADKICNVRDVAHAPPADWSRRRRLEYLDWAEQVVAGCRGVNPRLDTAFDEALGAARAELAEDARS